MINQSASDSRLLYPENNARRKKHKLSLGAYCVSSRYTAEHVSECRSRRRRPFSSSHGESSASFQVYCIIDGFRPSKADDRLSVTGRRTYPFTVVIRSTARFSRPLSQSTAWIQIHPRFGLLQQDRPSVTLRKRPSWRERASWDLLACRVALHSSGLESPRSPIFSARA
jgi:hypothetical protein